MRYFPVLIIFICSASLSIAQNSTNYHQTIENLASDIIEKEGNEAALQELIEQLEYYYNHPVNINQASADDLNRLHLLNAFQVISLLDYVKRHGGLSTIYELRQIEGFNQVTIQNLLPFITIGPAAPSKPSIKKIPQYGRHQVFVRTQWTAETPLGYQPSTEIFDDKQYPGNKYKLYTRYKFQYKQKVKWGFTAEKDAGEKFFKPPQKHGFDFYSAHVELNNFGPVKTLVLGDFSARFGQGLIAWSGFGGGKSGQVITIRKTNRGLHKYSSTNENWFFRGAGITMQWKNFDFTTFGSYKSMNATTFTPDSLAPSEHYFTSFYDLGIHATEQQFDKKDALKEMVAGTNLNYSGKKFTLGFSGLFYQYNLPLQPREYAEYLYHFEGKSHQNYSIDAVYRLNRIHLFSEAAVSQNGGKAVLAGSILKLSGQVQAALLYRNYSKNYQSMYGQAFGESSSVQNENGLYAGLVVLPVKKWKISAYYDFFKHPWLTYQASSPSKGRDYLIQADYVPGKYISMYGRFKSESKETDAPAPTGIPALMPATKKNVRYQINIKLNQIWSLRNRVEWCRYSENKKNSENGYLLYQDVVFQPLKIPFSIYMRYAVFNTDSYNARIYSYESDVLYAFSIPAYFNKGARTYLMAKYTLSENLDIWFRVAQTYYSNATSIGSGLDEIEGNKKTTFKVQFRWKI